MEKKPKNIEFTELVREILQHEYKLDLTGNTRISGPDDDRGQFDFSDFSRHAYVRIIDSNRISDKKRLEENIQSVINFLTSMKLPKPPELYVVFTGDLTSKDREYYQRNILTEDRVVSNLLDQSDIEKLAEKYNLRNPAKETKLSAKEATFASSYVGADLTTKESGDVWKKHLTKLLNQKRKFFAVGYLWENDDRMPRFLKEGIWQDHTGNENIYKINSVKKNDVVFLKSSYNELFRIRAIGVVSNNPKNGQSFQVNWQQIPDIDLPEYDEDGDAILQIRDDLIPLIFEEIVEKLPDLFEIIQKLSNPEKQIINRDFFTKKYENIVNSSEFYFQKARDVLEQLKEYGMISGASVKGGIEATKTEKIPLVLSYEILEIHWKKNRRLSHDKFIEYLKDQQPDLIPLYQLIGKFLSFVARNSWEHDDKKSIGIYPGNLLGHFLQYAINDFTLNPKHSNNVFNRLIEYLQEPELRFNILAPRQQELISNYFLEANFKEYEFHRRLLNYFKKFGFSVGNPENLTCLYTAILYDPEIRKLWDKEGKTDIEEEEPDIEEPEISVIKTGLDNDGAFAPKDLLEIENDVRSFALILASKEIKPPLAVALFGKWGSGKSFFMEQLSKRVDELSNNQGFLEEGETTSTKDETKETDAFCKGIAQIKFNAWSYLDANLWAGLVSSIFEKLDEYISNRSKGDNEKLELKRELSDELEILSSEKRKVRKEKISLEEEQEKLKKELEELIVEKDNLIENIASQNLSEIIDTIASKSKLEQIVKNDFVKYGITEERIDELSPAELYTEAKSWINFIKNLIDLSWSFRILLFFAVSALFFVWIDPNDWATNFFSQIGRQITAFICIAGPMFSKGYNSFSKLKKIVQPVTDFKNKFNKEIEDAKFKYEQDKELLEVNIQNKHKRINEAETKVNELDKQIEDKKYTLKNFIAKKAFNNFIQGKVANNAYDEHLGLISIIRKDFETLSDLFRETIIDTNASEEVQKKQEEKLNKHRKIKELFKEEKALDRIILYIDDLDRCSDEKVLEVIQAVHLIMAFPLFNVVVGVDRRCVENALIYKNLLQYSKYASLDKIEEVGIHVISPGEYLEKIFQIPFQLDDPTDKSIKGMVNSLLKDQIEIEEPDVQEIQPEVKMEEKPEIEKESIDDLSEDSIEEEKVDEAINEDSGISSTKIETKPKQKTVTAKDLKLTETELLLLEEIAWLVGSIPRTIKRFINIYRIIRAHKDLEYDKNKEKEEFLIVMFILAIHIGQYKKHAPMLMKEIASLPIRTLSSQTLKSQIF